ncbi:MAG: hypothetical protein U0835_04570 [Isosphaeraceae bacterium]
MAGSTITLIAGGDAVSNFSLKFPSGHPADGVLISFVASGLKVTLAPAIGLLVLRDQLETGTSTILLPGRRSHRAPAARSTHPSASTHSFGSARSGRLCDGDRNGPPEHQRSGESARGLKPLKCRARTPSMESEHDDFLLLMVARLHQEYRLIEFR